MLHHLHPEDIDKDSSQETFVVFITKTRLYNFDPIKLLLSYSKTGVYRGIHYFSSSFCSRNIDCGYPLEPHRRGGSNENPQSMF